MCILSDADILARRRQGQALVEPFVDANLTPNGVDLTVAEILLPDREDAKPVTDGVATIPPHTRFVVATREVVTLPGDACAQLWIRSTWARRGAIASFGKVEAGFSGTLTIGAFNAGASDLRLPIGERFCQIAFETLDGRADTLYAERSGNYQHQRGVTLEPVRRDEAGGEAS